MERIKAVAVKFAEDVGPVIQDIKAEGITTLAGIADEMNERGILTARRGKWHPSSVRAVLSRLE